MFRYNILKLISQEKYVLVRYKLLNNCLLALTLIFFCGHVCGQDSSYTLVLDQIKSTETGKIAYVSEYLYTLPDEYVDAKIEDVSAPHLQTKFQKLDPKLLDQYSDVEFKWLRLSIKLNDIKSQQWLLTFSDPYWKCYTRNDQGELITHSSGIFTPISERILNSFSQRDISSVPLYLQPGKEQTFWIRLKINPYPYTGRHKNLVKLNRTLLSSQEAYRFIHINDFANALILGILLTVCFYHLIIFLYYRDWRFFHLAYYNFSHFLIILFYNGWLLVTFFSESPVFHYEFFEELLLIFSAIAVFFLLRSFFETQDKFPIWDKILRGILGVHIFVFGFVLICRMISQELYYQVFPFVLTPWIIFNFLANIFNLVLGVHATKKGIRHAEIYLGSFFVLVLGITVEHLYVSGVIQAHEPTQFLPREWGATLQCIILAFGLAKSFKSLSDEKYEAELQHRLELERIKRDRELDHFKTQLYDNITHEFRTPLTIIKGMTNQIPHQPLAAMDAIHRNSEQLLQLVNDMLELSKKEVGDPTLNLRQGNIITFLRYLLASLKSWADQKQIKLFFISEETSLIMDYDPKKLQHIVFNLLSNAIKFTPEGGKITVEVKRIIPRLESSIQFMEMTIEDTGAGISPQDIPHIFDRHYQVEGPHKPRGSGIGLAIVKDLVNLHEGRVHVASELGQSTRVTVQFPIKREAPIEKRIVMPVATPPPIHKDESESHSQHSDVSMLLIVEDDPDVRFYLKALLEDHYELLMATNGDEGIEMALEHTPDIIISDIMMPVKDGYELCQTLKKDVRASHIPILLLSAKDDLNARIKGLKEGADAHLGKPFEEDELMARIAQLIAANKQLQQALAKEGVSTQTISKNKAEFESSFIKRAREIVEENLTDPKFDVNVMSEQLMMSRSQLYRKLRALTNRSTSSFIRLIKLQKAFALLRTTDLSITEISYQVGFNDPTYFARCFRNEFGQSPRDFRDE